MWCKVHYCCRLNNGDHIKSVGLSLGFSSVSLLTILSFFWNQLQKKFPNARYNMSENIPPQQHTTSGQHDAQYTQLGHPSWSSRVTSHAPSSAVRPLPPMVTVCRLLDENLQHPLTFSNSCLDSDLLHVLTPLEPLVMYVTSYTTNVVPISHQDLITSTLSIPA